MKFKIRWIDRGREPQCAPNPLYPNGIDAACTTPSTSPSLGQCRVDLPYPAKRCGLYLVKCETCGFTAAITTAGRSDDPRSVKLPCLAVA